MKVDKSGDGSVDYKEFVNVLARDTVAPAALGKQGMQAKDAMGCDGMGKKAKVMNVKYVPLLDRSRLDQ